MMNKTKRIFAAILALIMLMSLQMTGFSYYTGAVTEETAYDERYIMALNTLYGLGVLDDNTPKAYEEGITREQFAKAASALLGGSFINVPEPTEQNVTIGEAVKMLVDGTENTIRAEKQGYLNIAGQMGITHGLAKMQSYDNLTYAAAVQMLYNSMRVTPGDIQTVSASDVSYAFDEDYTVLGKYLDVEYRQGFVTADGFWSLNPGTDIAEDEIVINGKAFNMKNPSIDDYVGYYVNYYYSAEEDMILAVEKSANAQQVILDGDDVTNFSNNEYEYYADGKKKKYKVAENAYIVSNFVPVMSANVDMYPANSDIVLVDADGNGIYETVFIKTYTELEVSMLDAENGTLTGAGGVVCTLSEDIPARVFLDGEMKDYASVTSGLHASVVIEPETEIVREIYLSAAKISGEITSIAYDDDSMVITVGETKYVVALPDSVTNKITLGMNAVFSINFKGEIAYMDNVGGGGSFGYLIGAAADGVITKQAKLRLLTADGTIQIYNCANNCKIDGNKKTAEEIEALFKNESGIIEQLIWYETNSRGEISGIELPLGNDSTLSYDDRRLHVSVDSSDGSLGWGDASESFSERSLLNDDTVIFNVPKAATRNDMAYQVGEEPVSEYFKVYNFEKNDAYADAVVAVRQTEMADYGVCGGPGEPITKSRPGAYCIVKSCATEYVEEYDGGFDMIEFVIPSTGETEKRILADNAQWVVFSSANDTKELISYTTGSKDLKPGDIFNYRLNLAGEIGTVHKVYDASEGSLVKGKMLRVSTSTEHDFDYTETSNFGSWTGYIRAVQGYAVDATADYLAISHNAPTGIAVADRSELSFFKKQAKTYVYEITPDGDDAELREITLGQITPAVTTDDKLVLTTVSGAILNLVVVYKTPAR